jgi:hypothetical protein
LCKKGVGLEKCISQAGRVGLEVFGSILHQLLRRLSQACAQHAPYLDRLLRIICDFVHLIFIDLDRPSPAITSVR